MDKYFVIVGCILAIIALIAILNIRKKKLVNFSRSLRNPGISLRKTDTVPYGKEKNKKVISFDEIHSLTHSEEARLMELKNKNLIARINNIIPGTMQAIANAATVGKYKKAIHNAGQLYRAIIPKDAVLDNSRAMEGAFRGSFRNIATRIKGNANWVPEDLSAADDLAAMDITNAVMGVAAMVVGQYYMTQINDQLERISDSISKIADFQDNEYKSKIYCLIAEVQKCSTFQLETMENEEIRKRELDHLKNLEHECSQLLGQANITLNSFTKEKELDYDKYENLVLEAYNWYQYQQILLEMMNKIGELTYVLNLGAISREYSYALYLPYSKQAESALEELNTWHKEICAKLEIDIGAIRRKRQGVEEFFIKIPALFNKNLHYKAIPNDIAGIINKQINANVLIQSTDETDLFQQDVQLIAKDRKLYFLPNTEEPQ